MRMENRTVIGIFADITAARRATDELHSKGISAARLVENDQEPTFTGTAEGEHHGGRGIKGFFSRLFGFGEDRSDWQLSSDSESFFQDAYDKKHHLVVIEDCTDVGLSREIITRMGGTVEEKGSQYYQTERGSQRDQSTVGGVSAQTDTAQRFETDVSRARDRLPAVDPAASSALGVDVDHMPFGHSSPKVSDRLSTAADTRAAGMGQPFSADPSPRTGVPSDSNSMPFAGRSLNTGVTVHGGPAAADRPTLETDRALNGISGDADRTPLVGHRAGNRSLENTLVGDDRVHDRGVSNADVSRLSSDRIMELDDEDQPIVDRKGDDFDRVVHPDETQDESIDNGHILPDRSFPPHSPSQPGV